MSKQEALKIIREECVKANPEIMELKFGCEVRLDGKYKRKVFMAEYDGDAEPYRVLTESEQAGMLQFTDTKDIKIIGRPVQLSDVLLAINKDMEVKLSFEPLAPSSLFIQANKDCFWWDLTKPLEDQSEETLNFIAGLLTN